MIAMIKDLMLVVSSSLAASIVAKATVVTVLALVATRLARRGRASVRHVLLAAAFGVLLGLPIASFVAPTVRVSVPVAVQEPAPVVVETIADPVSMATGTNATSAKVATPLAWTLSPSALLAGWLAGTILFALPVLVGLWQLRAIRRSGLPWRHGRAMVDELARDAGIRRRIDVLLHEAAAGPMTCGVLHPTVVLPLDAQAWTDEDIARAVVHELEHVRRGDWASQCVARAMCAVYWFHPLVWIARRQLALEAERACDDAVLLAGHDASTDYADQLVGLAKRLSVTRHQPLLAMANRSDLAARVSAVLDPLQPRGRAGTVGVAVACAAAALLVAIVSPLRIVASQAGGTKPKYDTASIKPCDVEPVPTGARGAAGGTNATFSPGRFYVPCVTTEQLIYLAYASYGARDDEHLVNDDAGTASNSTKIRGGPAWVHSLRDKYSIEATAVGATERTVLMGSMLQSLLEDRFHLKVHRDTEEVPLLELTVAKGGLKLKPMKDGDCDPNAAPSLDPNVAVPKCGNLNMTGVNGLTRWTFNGFQLSSLASQLSRVLGVHVIDKTGVTDKFIFRFEFNRDEATNGDAASVYAALQDLGLKLDKTKGPRGFIVIDRIERPTPDGPDFAADAASSGKPVVPARARPVGGRRP